MIKNYYFILTVLLIISSCGPSRKATDRREDALFNSWLHHSKSELVQAWGMPDSVIAKSNGGEIFVYKERLGITDVMNENYSGKQYSYRKEMYINTDSTIYYWRAFRHK